jgi:hypothetical protein
MWASGRRFRRLVISRRPVDWLEKPLGWLETPPGSLVMQARSNDQLGWLTTDGLVNY